MRPQATASAGEAVALGDATAPVTAAGCGIIHTILFLPFPSPLGAKEGATRLLIRWIFPMKHAFAPCLIATFLLSGCAALPDMESPQPQQKTPVTKSVNAEINRLLMGGDTQVAGVLSDISATTYTVAAGDTALAIIRRAGAPQSLFYDLPERDQRRLARLSPGDQMAILSGERDTYVGLATAHGGSWQMARQGAGGYRLTDGFDLAPPVMQVLDLPVKGSIQNTLAQSNLDGAYQAELTTLLARGLPEDDLSDGWLRLRLEHQYINGVEMGGPALVSAALSVSPDPMFMVRYRLGSREAAYYNGDGERLEPDWISHPLRGKYRITSEFNPRRLHPITGQSRPHNGRDFAARRGTPVVAATDGTVVHAGRRGSWGKLVVLRHGNGLQTRYAHLRSVSGLSVGDTVRRGQMIGRVGTTGLSTGPHLHFEVHQRGLAKNPETFEPGRSRVRAMASFDSTDRLFFAQYRDMEANALAQLPKRGMPTLMASAGLYGMGGPDEDFQASDAAR